MVISLRLAFTLLIVLVAVLLVSIVLYLSYEGNKYTTFKITEKLMEQAFTTTSQKLNFYFDSSYQSIIDIEYFIANRDFDLKNKLPKFLEYLKQVLIVNPSLTGAYLGTEEGFFYMAKKMKDGSISYRVITRTSDFVISKWQHRNRKYEKEFPNTVESLSKGYDPRKKPWYKKSKEFNKTIWTNPYIFTSDQSLGISIATPILTKNVEGVIALDFGLIEINNFIKSLPLSKIASIFMIDGQEKIFAYNAAGDNNPRKLNKEILKDNGEKTIQLLSIYDIDNPVIPALYEQYLTLKDKKGGYSLYKNAVFSSLLNYYIGLFTTSDFNKFEEVFYEDDLNSQSFYSSYSYGNQNYLFMLKDFKVADFLDSKLGIVIPQTAVIGYFEYTYQIILFITIFIVIVSLFIITYLLNKGISSPIMNLSNKMSIMVRDFELSPSKKTTSNLKEIKHMLASFENVRGALSSFAKFLPREVVADIISKGKEAVVGGEKKEVTIFFSDIQDFTKISEENPSDILLIKLREYFNLVNNIIASRQGILDKYIGDAVMAMWGVPREIKKPAAQACLAAIEIVEALKKLNKKFEAEEFPKFYTRIGIHTGSVVVGNIGSEHRLNYTCVGDGVNLSSRLEGLNKIYKTQILVSNITLQHAKEYVESRLIDRIIVKGKTQKILIHEILAKKGELYGDEKIFLKYYKGGIKFFFDQYWEDAVRSFKEANKLKPDDFITQMYLKKSLKFSKEKPNSELDEPLIDRRRS